MCCEQALMEEEVVAVVVVEQPGVVAEVELVEAAVEGKLKEEEVVDPSSSMEEACFLV